MALIKCPQCNNEISDKALKCPKCSFSIQDTIICEECGARNKKGSKSCVSCGYPFEELEKCSFCNNGILDENGYCNSCGMDNKEIPAIFYKKSSGNLPKRNESKKYNSFMWILIPALCIITILAFFSSLSGTSEEVEDSPENYNSYDEYVEAQKIVSDEPIIEETYTSVLEGEKNIDNIFYGEIGLNKTYYMGKEVCFSIMCGYGDEEMEEISTGSNLCYGSVTVIFGTPQNIPDGEYITVVGTLGEEHSATSLLNAEIICRGNDAKENYEEELENFKQSFLEAETVSYEELLRYPDTYKDQKIKLDVNITDVETDGAIFNGTISANIAGTNNEIAIYDYRDNREPRIKEGDKLTIYCVGNGTIDVKIKEGNSVFSETIDEYEIPCVYLQYLDFR